MTLIHMRQQRTAAWCKMHASELSGDLPGARMHSLEFSRLNRLVRGLEEVARPVGIVKRTVLPFVGVTDYHPQDIRQDMALAMQGDF